MKIIQKMNRNENWCNQNRNASVIITENYVYDCCDDQILRLLNETNDCSSVEKFCVDFERH
jgi:hypothetical protein